MKKLIINADDFGLHPLINKGIIEGHQKGMITSTAYFAGSFCRRLYSFCKKMVYW